MKTNILVKSLCTATLVVCLAACNTVQGLGQDIESVGRKGEEVIKD
jgi:predicted small secreted protein